MDLSLDRGEAPPGLLDRLGRNLRGGPPCFALRCVPGSPCANRAWSGASLALCAVALVPHALRMGHPSLFGDDVPRVFLLQHATPWEALTTAFNEHVAPAFDAVSWLCWIAGRRRLTAMPIAFTAAAFVPFVLVVTTLAAFARRVLDSRPAAMLAVAVFAIAPVHVVETVWWYSGSNHMWAVFWTLVALIGVSRRDRAGLFAAAAGSALAPACSMMGVLAAPACAVFALSHETGRGTGPRREARFWPDSPG